MLQLVFLTRLIEYISNFGAGACSWGLCWVGLAFSPFGYNDEQWRSQELTIVEGVAPFKHTSTKKIVLSNAKTIKERLC